MQRTNNHSFFVSLFSGALALAGCNSNTVPPVDAAVYDSGPPDASLGSPSIIRSGGGSLVAVAGDVLRLDVVLVSTAGVQSPLPEGAMIEVDGTGARDRARVRQHAGDEQPTDARSPADRFLPPES